MNKTNLGNAFRLRNKLKASIKQITEQMESLRYAYAVDELEKGNTFRELDGLTVKEVLEKFTKLSDILCSFNKSIDKANLNIKETLISLETLKAKISFYASMLTKIRNSELVSKFTVNGERKTEILTPVLNQKEILEIYNSCLDEKDNLEQEIGDYNAKTMVDFDTNIIKEILK
ncbi:MAG: hypothetical protein LBV16_07960 [Elusimicrobiota bacterium]|jgi:hypothetical protein|nr:hypothetical protein [Elusimicrobiota bacterium]